MGIAVFGAERMIVVVTDGRTSLPADAPPRAFISYGGNYQFDGTKLVTHADGASNPAMLKDQVRHVEFESRDRMVAAPISGLVGQNVGLRLAWERIR
jgi:Lipocalin-like domain